MKRKDKLSVNNLVIQDTVDIVGEAKTCMENITHIENGDSKDEKKC